MRLPAKCAILSAALLAACQEQRTVVLEQSSSANLASNTGSGAGMYQAAPRPSLPPSPCIAPAGTGPFERLHKPLSATTIRKPDRALAEHVHGCAGVRFRIGPDGLPRDMVVMAEYPAGYGFGEVAREAIAGSRWEARDDLSWRYLIINM